MNEFEWFQKRVTRLGDHTTEGSAGSDESRYQQLNHAVGKALLKTFRTYRKKKEMFETAFWSKRRCRRTL